MSLPCLITAYLYCGVCQENTLPCCTLTTSVARHSTVTHAPVPYEIYFINSSHTISHCAVKSRVRSHSDRLHVTLAFANCRYDVDRAARQVSPMTQNVV
jgi:hypothetical protein